MRVRVRWLLLLLLLLLRLLHTLSLLADDPDVAVVYVTHRQDNWPYPQP